MPDFGSMLRPWNAAWTAPLLRRKGPERLLTKILMIKSQNLRHIWLT
jgi:hypothetical protein